MNAEPTNVREENLSKLREFQNAAATVTVNRDDNPDSIEIGTPGKGGAVKIYGDFNDKAAFEAKIKNAAEIRKYAQVTLEL